MTNPVNRLPAVDGPPLTPAQDRQWAFVAHCGGILGFVPSLLVYIFLRRRGPFTDQESLEALNFTLPPTILAALANLLAMIFGLFSPALSSVFALLALAVWVFLTVYSVAAALQVNKGQPYRYRFNLRLIK
ncbi:DUF4870 domain-containing protein [Specibacter cremeus]|uniref:DUF4870 domain-containing protein n=1 Tax=Specibacter cremeus TaxID=1629051 RepID=UPI001F0BAD61|nr:DUF4870 domain-containing protein [Specibacter cremeus]